MSELPALPPAAEGQAIALPTGIAPTAVPTDTAGPVAGVRFRLHEGVDASALDAGFSARVSRLYAMTPPAIRDEATVTDAVRSRERQADAFARYQAGTGGRAAAPGASQHDPARRAALDFSGNGAFLTWAWSPAGKQALASVGLEMPFDDDRGHMQLSRVGGRSDAVTTQRRDDAATLTADELPSLVPAGSTASATSFGSRMTADGVFDEGLSSEVVHEETRGAAALANGIRRGLTDVPLAIGQLTLPREQMEPIEANMRQFESNFAELENEHPNLTTLGRIVGSTVAVMAGARLLGAASTAVLPVLATRAASAVWEGAGMLGRATASGATVGALQFYEGGPEGEKRPFDINARTFDSGVGTVLGVLGGSIARSLVWAANNVSDTAFGRGFTGLLQQTTNGTARNAGEAQAAALMFYRQVAQKNRANYTFRNELGQELRGFPTGVGEETGFDQAIDAAVAASEDAGVTVKPMVDGVARRVREILGIDTEKARLAEVERLQSEYAEKQTQFGMGEPIRDTLPPEVQAAERARRERLMRLRGEEAPPAFVPKPTTGAEYAEARTEINDALARAVRAKEYKTETTLKMMVRGLDAVAEAAAAAEGLPAQRFIRAREAADNYFKTAVVPLRQFFGGRSYERATAPIEQGGMSTAAVYDTIAKVVGRDDVETARSLARVLGPRGQDNLTQVLASEALRAGELDGEGSAIRYVMSHQNVMREMLGRDRFTELMGMAKIAGELTARVQARSPRVFDWSHSVAPVFAISAFMGGHYQHMAKIMLVLPAYHIGLAAIQRIHQTPVARTMMRSAARMRPGSPELSAFTDRVERVVRGGGAATTEAVEQERER